MILRRVKVLEHERALVFRDGAFEGVLGPGVHWMLDLELRLTVEVVSIRNGWLIHPDLELMVRSGRLGREVRVVDLKTHQRAIVWADGRLELVLKPGVYALWTALRDVRVDVIDARAPLLVHEQLAAILAVPGTAALLFSRSRSRRATSGSSSSTASSMRRSSRGCYELWSRDRIVAVTTVDLRERGARLVGQEVMTADKVTLRLNLVVKFHVVDAALVRSLRDGPARVGVLRGAARGASVHRRAHGRRAAREARRGGRRDARGPGFPLCGLGGLALEVVRIDVKDVVLPGEMKALLNQVIEAEKARQAANVIARREETAATRSLANTARLLEENPRCCACARSRRSRRWPRRAACRSWSAREASPAAS